MYAEHACPKPSRVFTGKSKQSLISNVLTTKSTSGWPADACSQCLYKIAFTMKNNGGWPHFTIQVDGPISPSIARLRVIRTQVGAQKPWRTTLTPNRTDGWLQVRPQRRRDTGNNRLNQPSASPAVSRQRPKSRFLQSQNGISNAAEILASKVPRHLKPICPCCTVTTPMRRCVASIRNLSERRVSEICVLFAACSTAMFDINELFDIYVSHG